MRFRLIIRSAVLAVVLLLPARGHAVAFRDSVAAYVDDHAITMSEVADQLSRTREAIPDVSRSDVLSTIINRVLLVREAKKYRIEAPSEDQMVKEYIDLKVRAFIRVREERIEEFYRQNADRFGRQELEEARDEIEQFIIEQELNERLREMIAELRRNAYIMVHEQR